METQSSSTTQTERRLLMALLFDPHRFEEIAESLSEAHFEHPVCRFLFRGLSRIYSGGEEPSLPALQLWMSDQDKKPDSWQAEVEEIVKGGGSAHLVYDAKLIRRRFVIRSVGTEGRAMHERSLDVSPMIEEDVDRAVDESVDAVLKIQQVQSALARDDGPVIARDAIKEYLVELERKDRPGDIETGMFDVDRITGGFRKGQMIILAARPSQGKSTMALQWAANMARGEQPQRVLFVSGEMTAHSITSKLLARQAEVDSRKMRARRISTSEGQRLREAAAAVSECRLVIYDRQASVPQMRGMVRQAQSKGGLDVVFVDYLQLMIAPRAESRVAEIEAISRELKRMAQDLNVLVIATAQLNREAHETKPSLHHLKGSGSIEQDADAVLLLWPDDWQDGTARTTSRLSVAKNREGGLGETPLAFFRDYSDFRAATIVETVSLSGDLLS